jgi:Gpi18-like mannosyltransferase
MNLLNKKLIVLSGLLYVTYIVVMNKWGHLGDMDCWMRWSKYMHQFGLTRAYDPENGCDYLPGFLYVLWLNTKIQHTATNVQDNLYVFKFFVLLFDFAAAWLAVHFVKDENKKLFGFIFILVNAAFVYNTLAWAQVDAIFTCFGFASILAALHKKIGWSLFFLVVSFNFKLQALVFVPVAGLLLLPQYLHRFSVVLTARLIVLVVAVQLTLVFPFLVKGKISGVWDVLSGYVGHYPYISMAAFNFWFLAIPGDPEHHAHFSDSTEWLGLTFNSWGYILFFLSLFLVIFPMLQRYFRHYVKGLRVDFPLEKVFLMSALTPAIFFYFNTQMHERYFHPALVSLAAYTFLTSNYFPLVLGSIAYFLNLERILQSLALTNYNILAFQPVFIALLFACLIIYLFYRLYASRQFSDQTIQLFPDA